MANDGIWFMDAGTYHESFQFTAANPDVTDEHQTYFAAFDIETPYAD